MSFVLRRRWTILPSLESLEPLRLLTGLADTIVDSSVLDPRAETSLVAASGTSPKCFVDRSVALASALRPAPLDLNLDGRFDTADIILAFQTPATVINESAATTTDRSAFEVIFESSDFVDTLSMLAYESSTAPVDQPCVSSDQTERHEFAYYQADGESVRETVAYVLVAGQLQTRTSKEFDGGGHLRYTAVDTYDDDSGRVAARSESSYDIYGRPISEQYLVYDADGSAQALTVTVYNYGGDSVFQVTNDVSFNDRGQVTRRKVHRLDAQKNLIDLEIIKYETVASVSGDEPPYDSTAELDRADVVRETLHELDILPELIDWSYLKQVRDAYLTARLQLEAHYRSILEMNELQVQGELEQRIRAAQLSSTEADRFRRLNLYYHLVKDIASLNQEDAPQELFDRYSHFVDPVAGVWQSWFIEFAREEHLTLPLPPIRITFPSINSPPGDRADLAERFRQSVGPNPAQYFQNFRLTGQEEVDRLLESMRRVKAQLKLLELRSETGFPAFDLIMADDKPDTTSVGQQQIQLLTSWFFFETDEQGKYLRDEPSEAVIRRRVQESLTDEELFYALDIEHWSLDGDPQVIEASLRKLKYVADLIHECNPNILIGYYRLLPRRDPTASYAGPETDRYDAWQTHNNRVASQLQSSVDLLFPSLYTIHLGNTAQTTAEVWTIFAEGNLQEAQRVAEGKPVVPFLSLYYHSNGVQSDGSNLPRNLKGWQWIEPELLLHQMLILNDVADAFVLYNDLPVTWGELDDLRLTDALDLFHSARQSSGLDELQNAYRMRYLKYRNELLAREEVERQLGEIQQARSRSRNIFPRLANLLTREIDQLQDQLDGMIQFWDLLSTP